MPLAADKCRVSGAAESGWPSLVALQSLVDAEQALTGQQHGARWHAGRSVEPALHIRAVKRQSSPRQAIEVRRLDNRVAERGNRVGPLIVGKEK